MTPPTHPSPTAVDKGAPREIAGESLVLLGEPAVWWPGERTLFVADVHLGKAATFRASGVPVPDACAHDLDRLTTLIDDLGVARLVILGDLIHARIGRTGHVLRLVDAWRERHADLDIVLVRGNHDRSSGDPPKAWGMTVVDPGEAMGPFALHHEPRETKGERYALCGHIHPAARIGAIRGRGRFAAEGGPKFPAYAVGEHQMTLPAFGSFTGTKVVNRDELVACYVIADGEAVRLP